MGRTPDEKHISIDIMHFDNSVAGVKISLVREPGKS